MIYLLMMEGTLYNNLENMTTQITTDITYTTSLIMEMLLSIDFLALPMIQYLCFLYLEKLSSKGEMLIYIRL